MRQINSIAIQCIFLGFLAQHIRAPPPPPPLCPEHGCWQRCFSNPPSPLLTPEFVQIFQFLNQTFSMRLSGGPTNTVLLPDLSHQTFSSYLFQNNLMKLTAFTLVSDLSCNPTALVGHVATESFTWFPVNVENLHACQLSLKIDALPYYNQSAINPLDNACVLANSVMNTTISYFGQPHRRHAIAFTNSPQTSQNPSCGIFPYRTAVEISNDPSGFESDPSKRRQMIYSDQLLDASEQVLRCVSRECCFRYPNPYLLTKPVTENPLIELAPWDILTFPVLGSRG